MRRSVPVLPLVATLLAATAGVAQDGNYLLPIPHIEALLRDSSFTVVDARGSRAEGDRTSRMAMQFSEHVVLLAKWAPAARGGSTFNNEPRYEVAAFELQKLFLPEEEWVVPPTLLRAFPQGFVDDYFERVPQTFDDAASVVVAVQYWLSSVRPDDFWDEDRFEADTVYARYLANMNVLTHLIDHRDSNTGNFLISTVEMKPRVFSVDNGVAFRSQRSDRGTVWRNLRVDRLPHATVARLRTVTEDDLMRALGVIAEFEIRDGLLVPRAPTANLDEGRGVRERDGVFQFGLTGAEIRDVAGRIAKLLERVDEGRITVF